MSLSEQQTALMSALIGGRPVPDGFDAERVRAAAAALSHKRERACAQAWPELKAMLGGTFHERFAAYAAATPLPQMGGPLADGRLFARWLKAHRVALTDGVKGQALMTDLCFKRRRRGLLPRHGPCVKSAWLPATKRWILAIYVPGLMERYLSVGFKRD